MRHAPVTTVLVVTALAVLAGPALAQPANDAFADATPVTTLPSFDSLDVTDATVEPGEPDGDCAPVANTVWYGLTLPDATEVAVDTAGSDYDTVVGVYTGTDVGDLNLVACNDDVAAAGFSLQARVVFSAEAGTTYWVQAAAFDQLFEGGQLEVAFRRSTLDGITCDAELDEELEFPVYLVAPGDTVRCVAPALDPEQPASWQVDFFDFEQEDPVGGDGEDGVDPEPDGTLAFTFVVPDEIVFGEFLATVSQGEPGMESYREPVSGFIQGEVVDPDLACDPDPVTHGGTVECVVEQLRPGSEFFWLAEFFDTEFLEELEGDVDDLGEAMLEGLDDEVLDEDALIDGVEPFLADGVDEFVEDIGEADEDGVGRFDFDVPDDDEIVAYGVLVAAEDGGVAVYVGGVEPVPSPVDDAPGPKPVPRPVRIDTGAGGAVAEGSPVADSFPGGVVIGLGVLAVLVAVPVRRATRR